MSETTARTGTPANPGATATVKLGDAVPRADFWIFVILLVLALSGAAVSEAEDYGGHYYWSVLVLIFGATSVARSWRQAQGEGRAVWPMVRAQVLHWLGALVAIQIVLLFESQGVTDRGAAADYTLLVLALSSYLAGVHYNWTFLLLGCILAVTAVAIGFLDQFSIYLVTGPLALLAIWVVYRHRFGPAAPAR